MDCQLDSRIYHLQTLQSFIAFKGPVIAPLTTCDAFVFVFLNSCRFCASASLIILRSVF